MGPTDYLEMVRRGLIGLGFKVEEVQHPGMHEVKIIIGEDRQGLVRFMLENRLVREPVQKLQDPMPEEYKIQAWATMDVLLRGEHVFIEGGTC